MLVFSPMATDLPDPVTNCTAYNATAYTMQFTCVPGNDGGIKQSFFVEVIINEARKVNHFSHHMLMDPCRCLMERTKCITCRQNNRRFCYENFRVIQN